MASGDFKMKVVAELPARSGGVHGSPVLDPICEKLYANEGKWVLVGNRESAASAGGLSSRLRTREGVSSAQRKNADGVTFDIYAGFNMGEAAPAKRKRTKAA